MNDEVKTIDAPITGCGSIRNSAAYLGMNANMTSVAAQANAMYRLVAPVALDTPTRLGAVFIPITPSRPPTMQPMPPARMPRWMGPRSGRFQSLSLIFWHVVMTPTVRSIAAVPAIKNAGIRLSRKSYAR